MKWLFIALVVLLGAVSIALLVHEDPGYVLLAYGPWSVEMSLALLVVVAVLAFVALYFALRALTGLWRLPRRLGRWRERRRLRRARRALTRGLIQLAEGRWTDAEASLIKYARHSETPLLNYIAAARAAQHQGAHERRDHYLRLAHESTAGADIAVGLSQAELQLGHRQLEQSLATLRHLRRLAPHHAYVLKLLMKVYRELGEWDALRELLPELRKRHVLSADELDQLERTVHRERLAEAAHRRDPDALRSRWRDLPRELRRDEVLVQDYVEYLIALGAGEEAEQLVRQTLKREWDDNLAELYGRIEAGDADDRMKLLEEWLKQRPDNPTLLLAAGRLARRAQLWGKARSYLESSVAAAHRPDPARELGELLEELGDKDAALRAYRQAAQLAAGRGAPALTQAGAGTPGLPEAVGG